MGGNRLRLLSISVGIIVIITIFSFMTSPAWYLITGTSPTTEGGGPRHSGGIGGGGRGGESDAYLAWGEIIGFLALYSLILVFILGIPSIQKYLAKKYSLRRKDLVQLHCDLGLFTLATTYIHLLLLSFSIKWQDYFSWWEIYPKTYFPLDSLWSKEMGLTLGFWAGFMMLIATVTGYIRKYIYRYFGRKFFIYLQDLTVISIVGVIFHGLDIGKTIEHNGWLQLVLIISCTAVFIAWLWFKIPKPKSWNKKFSHKVKASY